MIHNAHVLFHGLVAPGKGFLGGFDQVVQDNSGNSNKKKLSKHRNSHIGYSASRSDIDSLILPRKWKVSFNTYEIPPHTYVFLRNYRKTKSNQLLADASRWCQRRCVGAKPIQKPGKNIQQAQVDAVFNVLAVLGIAEGAVDDITGMLIPE